MIFKQIDSILNEINLEKFLKAESDHRKRIKCTKIIRLFINTHISEDNSYIQIRSKILNDTKNNESIKFNELVEKVTIIFDSNKSIHEWNNTMEEVDSFEVNFTRCRDIKCIIQFTNKRNLYKLSTNLQILLNKQTDTKSNIIKSLYLYIKINKLLISNKNLKDDIKVDHMVQCDTNLKEIFGVESFSLLDLSNLLDEHLLPIDDLILDISHSYITDIQVEVDDLFQKPKMYTSDIYLLERKIETSIGLIKNLEKRKCVLKEFSDNPIAYINKWICMELEEYGNKSGVLRNKSIQEEIWKLLKE